MLSLAPRPALATVLFRPKYHTHTFSCSLYHYYVIIFCVCLISHLLPDVNKFERKWFIITLFKLGLGVWQMQQLSSYVIINIIDCDALNVKIGLSGTLMSSKAFTALLRSTISIS